MDRSKFWLRTLLNIFFPPVCGSCRKPLSHTHSLCDFCKNEIQYLRSPLCVRCGIPFAVSTGEDHICGNCIRTPPPYSLARGIAIYSPPVSELLHRLKYRADRTVLPSISFISVPFDFSEFASCDLIIPVPLYSKRLRQRGLNQSLLLARLFFPNQKKQIRTDILVRIRDTLPQTGLNGKERRRNLRAAFGIRTGADINGKNICLVDDVFTTGTTVSECAKVLLRTGANEVKIITMARVVDRF
jgi:ComF family protein